MVYDIEPFRAALRQGDWKLIWQTSLPAKVELFNLREDPGEQVNLADSNSAKVAELQQRIQLLSRDAVQPLVFKESFGVLKSVLFGSVALPAEENALAKQP